MRPAFLIAILLLAFVVPALPAAEASTTCHYNDQVSQKPLDWHGAYVSVVHYHCVSQMNGKTIDQRVDILRIAEKGATSYEDRILAHLEYHRVETTHTNGDRTAEAFVMLKSDTIGLNYHEVELLEKRQGGSCSSTATYYRGSQTSVAGRADVPGCPPLYDLLP